MEGCILMEVKLWPMIQMQCMGSNLGHTKYHSCNLVELFEVSIQAPQIVHVRYYKMTFMVLSLGPYGLEPYQNGVICYQI